jgi:hypothetical protein
MRWGLIMTTAWVAFEVRVKQNHEARQTVKETLARYRGLPSGVKYAEAVWATGAYTQDML